MIVYKNEQIYIFFLELAQNISIFFIIFAE